MNKFFEAPTFGRGASLPSTPRFVTSPCPGYTSRPNRAIDDRGLTPHKTRGLVGRSCNIKSATSLQPAHLAFSLAAFFCKSAITFLCCDVTLFQ